MLLKRTTTQDRIDNTMQCVEGFQLKLLRIQNVVTDGQYENNMSSPERG